MSVKRKIVMVFGVFDGLHEGHAAFLKAAKREGDYLIVVLARDEVVRVLKGSLPKRSIKERFQHLRDTDHVDSVVVGDAELGKWTAIELHHPSVIALGYDQTLLKKELTKYFKNSSWRPAIKVMESHEPEVYHSRLLEGAERRITP